MAATTALLTLRRELTLACVDWPGTRWRFTESSSHTSRLPNSRTSAIAATQVRRRIGQPPTGYQTFRKHKIPDTLGRDAASCLIDYARNMQETDHLKAWLREVVSPATGARPH